MSSNLCSLPSLGASTKRSNLLSAPRKAPQLLRKFLQRSFSPRHTYNLTALQIVPTHVWPERRSDRLHAWTSCLSAGRQGLCNVRGKWGGCESARSPPRFQGIQRRPSESAESRLRPILVQACVLSYFVLTQTLGLKHWMFDICLPGGPI